MLLPHVIDGGLRHAARDRKSLGEAGRQVGGAESCKFLFGIDVIAVLLREAASDGNSLSIGQHEACKRDWNKLRDIGNLDVRKPDLGHPDRQFPDYLDAFLAQSEHAHCSDRGNDDHQCCGPPRKGSLEQHEQRNGGKADDQRGNMGRRQMQNDMSDALKKITAYAFDAEKLR